MSKFTEYLEQNKEIDEIEILRQELKNLKIKMEFSINRSKTQTDLKKNLMFKATESFNQLKKILDLI